MAQYLIRQASGGQYQIIPSSGWPYFQNQGYIIVDTLDDLGDASPVYIDAATSDFRYLHVADIGNDASTGGEELRTFFEEKIDRTGATAGQVPVLQSDGSLEFAAGGGGGSVSTVAGVSPVSGNVPLTQDDIGDGATYVRLTAAQMAQLQLLLDHGVVMIQHTGGADPTRYNTPMHILWDVPDANRPATNGTTTGGSYAAVDGTDYIITH